ncbi:MAG: hypothetical protein JNN03_04270, partial [Rubrivivax sp.]|nr:hypothetical protein [Rubrivivax sp.]
MRQAFRARPHQAGGATLIVLIVLAVLAAAAYLGYRAFGLYQQHVAPMVEQASRVASGLNPYTVTKDPEEIAGWLKSSFRIAPPPGYVGAFGLNVEFLGRKHMRLMALIPRGVRPADIFEGGRGEIRFNPGPSTIFLATKSDRGDRDHMREGIARMVGGEGLSEPMKEVYIEVGERKVAAYRGAVQNYGAWNTIVYVFLDDGRMLHAAGPKGSFDEQALVDVLAALVAAHPANELLYQHPKPPPASAAGMDPCGIAGLPAEFDVVVVSVHKGSRPLDIAI